MGDGAYERKIWGEVGRYLLVGLLTFSALAKMLAPTTFVRATIAYGLPKEWLSGVALIVVVTAELVVAVLLSGRNHKFSGLLVGTVLSAFFLGLAIYSALRGIPGSHLMLSGGTFSLCGVLLVHELRINRELRGLHRKAAAGTLLFGLVVIAALATLGGLRAGASVTKAVSEKFIGARLTDLAPEVIELGGGRTVQMDSLLDNSVAIVGVFDLKCEKCVRGLRALDRFLKTRWYPGKLQMFAIVTTYSMQHLALFVQRFGLQLPTFFLPLPKETFSGTGDHFFNESAIYLLHEGRIIQAAWPVGRGKSWSTLLRNLDSLLDTPTRGDGETGQNLSRPSTSLRVVVVDTIGCKDCGRPYEIFANLRDLNTGPEDSLYVLDYEYREIRVFDSYGRYAHTILLPDTINRPSSIAVGPDGALYVVDQLYWKDARVYQIDRSGRIVDSFGLHFTPWLVRWVKGSLFISSFPYYGGETEWLIHKFSRNGRLLREFSHRRRGWKRESKPVGGFNGFLAVSNDLIFFAFGYPYDIRIFSPDGKLLRRLSRWPTFYGDIVLRKAEGSDLELQWWSGFCEGLVPVGDTYLLSLICDTRQRKVVVDVWSIGGQFLGTIDLENIVPKPHLIMTAPAPDQGFYMAVFYPYPHILRLSLVMS